MTENEKLDLIFNKICICCKEKEAPYRFINYSDNAQGFLDVICYECKNIIEKNEIAFSSPYAFSSMDWAAFSIYKIDEVLKKIEKLENKFNNK